MIGPMKIVGLTGSIGMGKSLAAAMLRRMGFPVFDSDVCARRVLEPGGEAFDATLRAFPDAIDLRTGALDRGRLRTIVFNDPARRAILESFIHPAVHRAQKIFLFRSRRMGARAAVLDIPLLFETGADKRCDAVLCVSAPSFIQRGRVLARPGMSEAVLRDIRKAQYTDARKRRLATRVIHTGLGRALTFASLRDFMTRLGKPAQRANVPVRGKTGSPAKRKSPVFSKGRR